MKPRSSLLFLVVLLGVAILTIGKFGGERFREGAVRVLSKVWTFSRTDPRVDPRKYDELSEENRLLKKALKEIADGETSSPTVIEGKVEAKVIYRPMNDWLSSFWIDLGTENGGGLIGLNSPVLYRGALLGVIDYLSPLQSRVLMITDPKLRPAVRVARGDPQRFLVAHQIDHLLHLVEKIEPADDQNEMLQALKKTYLPEGERFLLAKGELMGAISPLSSTLMKGVGFNLETADREGPARDLRSGAAYHDRTAKPIRLIQLYDLLVTSGLDGVFPEGIDVALVTKVGELDEGDVAYEIEAEPLFGPYEEIRRVEVLPPLPFDQRDLPPMPLQRRGVR